MTSNFKFHNNHRTADITLTHITFTINGIDSNGNFEVNQIISQTNNTINNFDFKHHLAHKQFELTNHLGNVLATVLDRKTNNTADVVTAQHYYPFGSVMSSYKASGYDYKYGYNTQEKVDEIAGAGNHYTAQFWEYDPRIVLRWNQDPKQIIGVSPYVVNGDNPNYYTDPLGDFRTKFGAKVYKFFHGGEIKSSKGGGYYVEKREKATKDAEGYISLKFSQTWEWGVSSAAEYIRGGIVAAWNFHKFLFGGGGNTTYGQGSFEADEMASSPGIQKGLEELRRKMAQGSNSTKFHFSFSPNPKDVLEKGLDGFSEENKEAHIDAFKDQSWTKLYIGGYSGTMTVINANTVKVIITNKTTANSFLLHGGELIFGEQNGAKRFNDLWNKTPFLNTQSQRFEFTVPLNK